MPTAFPSGYYLERVSRLSILPRAKVDFLDDGTPLSQQTTSTTWYRYTCIIGALTQAEKNTIVQFINDNQFTDDVTWTIDGVDLTGRFVGNVDVTMQGARYRLRFDYYAQEA